MKINNENLFITPDGKFRRNFAESEFFGKNLTEISPDICPKISLKIL